MRFNFYKINQSSDVANKLDNETPIFSVNIDLPQTISSSGCVVILDQAIEANFASYIWNGAEWGGYVTVDTMGNGIYSYNIKVDPLTTCWMNNCFKSQQYIERCTGGGAIANRVRDPLISVLPEKTIYRGTIASISNNVVYILNVPNVLPNNNIRNSGIRSYLLTADQLTKIIAEVYKMADKERASVLSGFLSIIAIPSNHVPNIFNYNVSDKTVYLPYIASYTVGNIPVDYKITSTQCTAKIQDNVSENSLIYKSTEVNIPSTPFLITTGSVSIDVSNLGTLNVDLASHGITKLTSIGYAYTIEPIGGVQKAYPYINGDVIWDVSISSKLGLNFPLYYDSHVTDYTQILMSGVSTVLSAVGAVATGGTSLPIQAALGAAALTSAGSIFTSLAVESGTTQTAINSATGLTPDVVSNHPSTYTVKFNSPVHQTDVENRFGKLKMSYDSLAGYKGYIQTRACDFPLNGLPYSIVREAESMVDAGVHII